MKVIMCDKCGKIMKTFDWSPVKFPYIKIQKIYGTALDATYDLCDDCQQKLEQWLQEKENIECD